MKNILSDSILSDNIQQDRTNVDNVHSDSVKNDGTQCDNAHDDIVQEENVLHNVVQNEVVQNDVVQSNTEGQESAAVSQSEIQQTLAAILEQLHDLSARIDDSIKSETVLPRCAPSAWQQNHQKEQKSEGDSLENFLKAIR